MKKLKKTIASVVVGTALTAGIVVGAPVANAAPAQAYTDYYGYYECSWGYIWHYNWRDYNWFEEYFQGRRDGYVLVSQERSYYC